MKYIKLSKHFFWVLAVVTIVSSCDTYDYYKEAINKFSLAAEMDVRNKAAQLETTNLTTLEDLYKGEKPVSLTDTSSINLYQKASENIGKALNKPSKLKTADFNLMGNAICLQSLSEWRLGNNNEALSKQKKALEELEQKPSRTSPDDERDLAMMTALPALVDLEMAYDSMKMLQRQLGDKVAAVKEGTEEEKKAVFDQLQAHYRQFITSDDAESGVLVQGLKHLEKSKAKADPKHPVQSYLLLSQLTGLNTWVLELSEIDNAARLLKLRKEDSPVKTWLVEQFDGYKLVRDAHLLTLEKTLPNGKANPTYISWKKRL